MARKILLADDSVTAQNMGRKILTDAGYEVVTVNNGSAALKKIVECKPTMVVLDVYMPGYSGLEVCARIKEGRDTSGMPVLLTVGKLEPFRQEEAQKVRADAFIIKPFEASELLAALAKLESKAVAQPDRKPDDTPKSARHPASTMDHYEKMVADEEPRFGDQDSGWKARLTMPSPGSKDKEAEEVPEIAAPPSGPFREFEREANERPSFAITPSPSPVDRSSLQGLPSDVTADELAAIAAAAAAVGGTQIQRDFEKLAPIAPSTSGESGSVPASVSIPSESEPAHLETFGVATTSSAGPLAEQVEAVFTSFANAAQALPVESKRSAPEPAAATVTASSESASFAVGPRWVAEEIPVGPAESALVLEREMQKAFAAFAAAEHAGSYEPGPVDKNDEPMFASSAPPAIGAPSPFSEQIPNADKPESVAGTPIPSYAEAPATPIAEQSAVSEISQPVASPFAPVAGEEPKHAVVAFGEPHPFGAVEARQASTPSADGHSLAKSASGEDATAASSGEGWHELRQPAVAAAAAAPGSKGDSTFEQFQSGQQRGSEVQSELQGAAMAAAAAGDSTSSVDASLSSIVDNMLAELKPKLMAELAKKLEKK